MVGLDLLQDLAIVMLVAGIAGWICQRIGLSAVVGFLLAGIIIGPSTPPFALISDLERIHTLSQLGLVFLMFSIGMFIGDVGQNTREEVDRQFASNPNGGENYGWRLREGTIQTPAAGVGGARPTGNVEPILDYDRAVGTTVTGGYVYRGNLAPSLSGKYIFADFGAGKIFTANPDGTGFQNATSLFDPPGAQSIGNPSSFGEDATGELYIVDYADGEIFRVIPEPSITALLGAITAAGLWFCRRNR